MTLPLGKTLKTQNRMSRPQQCGVKVRFSAYKKDEGLKGWLKYCDNYRLSEKYILPIQPYADRYYENHIKKKGGKNNETVSKSA